MGWKDWPYWLKGGIISLILTSIIGFISWALSETLLFIVFAIPAGLLTLLKICEIGFLGGDSSCILGIDPSAFLVFGLVPVLVYFLIGAFIGWIYGKIKNRNKESIINSK